jgi:hypothetical protein
MKIIKWHGKELGQHIGANSMSCYWVGCHLIKIGGGSKKMLTLIIGGPKSWFWK